MKHCIYSLVFAWGLILHASAEPDFRNAYWGWTHAQVKAVEPAEFIGESDIVIVYHDQILDETGRIYYSFNQNGLYKVQISFNQLNDPKAFIPFREKLEEQLRQKYGEPLEDDDLWTNMEFFYKPQNHWQALLLKHVRFKTSWQSKNTRIELLLGNALVEGSNKLLLYIKYTPINSNLFKL